VDAGSGSSRREVGRSSLYVLGHSDAEHRRLEFQAELVAPITRKLLVNAGIREGMHVLDVGTGRGDVAFIAGEIVGGSGGVVGIDSAPRTIAVARDRAAADSRGNVSFEEGDPVGWKPSSPLDAVVGRYVLQFLPDPAAALRQLGGHLPPGGILAFHEIDWTGHRSYPPVPIWDRCCTLITEAIAVGGAETASGSKLPAIFVEAGLPSPSLAMTTFVGAGANSHDVVQRLANLAISLLPTMEEHGLLARNELDPELLAQQLADAVTASASFVAAGSEVTAFTRVPTRAGT
jgi:SAM-dependent methyltransferase